MAKTDKSKTDKSEAERTIECGVEDDGQVRIDIFDGENTHSGKLDGKMAGLFGGKLLHAARLSQAKSGKPTPPGNAELATVVVSPTSCSLVDTDDGERVLLLFGCGDMRVGFPLTKQAVNELAAKLATASDESG